MAFGFAYCLLLLHLLSLGAEGGGATEANHVIRLNTMDDHMHHGHHPSVQGHYSSSPANHHDPQIMVFFRLQDLKPGNLIPIYFPNRDLSGSHLLPKEEADAIPFSLSDLPDLLHFFSFSPHSPQAIAMESTLKECEVKPIKGETKTCATSLESAHEFARATFGLTSDTDQVKILTTNHLRNSRINGVLQKYKVIEILEKMDSPKMVACHTLPYPYGVFYCHSQESENKVVMVSLEGEDGDLVEALGVCHMDTSQWSHDHVAFRVLGVKPRTTPVCHFFPGDNFVLIPSSTTM